LSSRTFFGLRQKQKSDQKESDFFMIRYNSIAIKKSDNDKFGKLALHSDLRYKLKIMGEGNIILTPIGKILILQKAGEEFKGTENIVDRIDWDGNIFLPEKLMDTMRWHARDEIAVYYVDDEMLIFSMNERYKGGYYMDFVAGAPLP